MNQIIINCIRAITLVTLLNQCAATGDSAASRFHQSPRLKEILTSPDERGSVYYQARRFDEFDYRDILTKATRGDAQALGRLFEYTKNGSQMGEGAETHMEVLGELLKQWEDVDYAEVLRSQSTEVVSSVAEWLNEYWGYAGWPRSTYPITQELCARSIQAEQVVSGNAVQAPH